MIFAGLRNLKQEDKWFKAGYAAAAINVVITMISIVSGTFINRRQIYDTYIWQFMLLWEFALPLIIASCFFRGMQTELKKREKEADNKILIHLVIWYAVIILLMNMNDSGWIIGIAVLATYIGILVELKHTAEDLEKEGMYWKNRRCVSPREVCGRGSCSNRSRTCNRNHILWFLPYEME